MADPVIALRVPAELRDALRAKAEQEGTDVSGLARLLLTAALLPEVDSQKPAEGVAAGLFGKRMESSSPKPPLRRLR